MRLGFRHHFINAGASLLADAHATHEAGERFIARAGSMIEDRLNVVQGGAGIGDFDATIENLDHRPGAANAEILMDDGIGDQLAGSKLGIKRHGAT